MAHLNSPEPELDRNSAWKYQLTFIDWNAGQFFGGQYTEMVAHLPDERHYHAVWFSAPDILRYALEDVRKTDAVEVKVCRQVATFTPWEELDID